jgi:hypothetical protein
MIACASTADATVNSSIKIIAHKQQGQPEKTHQHKGRLGNKTDNRIFYFTATGSRQYSNCNMVDI